MQKYYAFKELISALQQLDKERFARLFEALSSMNLTSKDSQLLDKLASRANQELSLTLALPGERSFLSGDTFHITSAQSLKAGTSIVSACMNRNENLLKAMKSWLTTSAAEIIIVDWNSSTPVAETISEYLTDSRVKVLRVEDEPQWILTYAFNVGLQCVGYDKVFKLDADIVVTNDFIEANAFPENSFIRGSWQQALANEDDSQVFINGSFGCKTEDLRKVAFYNEFIRSYGWDDSDLYQRLSTLGLTQWFLNTATLSHLEQDDASRIANQQVSHDKILGKFSPTDFQNTRNKYIAATWDQWWPENRQNYQISKVNDSTYTLQRATEHKYIPQWVIDHAEYLALSAYLRTTEWRLASQFDQPIVCRFLLDEYQAKIDFEVSAKLLLTNNDSTINGSHSEQFSSALLVAVGEHRRTMLHVTDTQDRQVEVLTSEQLDTLNRARCSSDRSPITAITLAESQLVSPEKQRLYIEVQHGLGNRMRALASAASLARAEHRDLVLVWIADDHCNCTIDDLFEYPFPQISSAPFYDIKGRPIQHVTYMELEPGHIKDQRFEIGEDKDIVIRSAYTLNHPSSTWQDDNAFLRSLEPTTAVRELLGSVYYKGGIGCHIRMQGGSGQQLASYDSTENWSDESHQAITEWRDKSHYSRFLDKIKSMPEHDNLGIFCAADLSSTYDKMKSTLGKRMRALTRETDANRDADDLVYALADAIMLSRSTILLGSGWSSFTELALRLSTTIETKLTAGEDF